MGTIIRYPDHPATKHDDSTLICVETGLALGCSWEPHMPLQIDNSYVWTSLRHPKDYLKRVQIFLSINMYA